MSLRRHLYDFLRERVAAIADAANPCFGVEVLDSASETPQGECGIMFGDVTSDLAPNRGATTMQRFDADVTLVTYVFIGDNESERADAIDRAEAMGLDIAAWFHADMTMNGRVRNSRALDMIDGTYEGAGGLYAVANLPLIINETGKRQTREER